MAVQVSYRLDSDVAQYIREIASESEITQRKVVELSVLACLRLGLFEALTSSGLDADDYENLVRTACDSHMSDELYDYMQATLNMYEGLLW